MSFAETVKSIRRVGGFSVDKFAELMLVEPSTVNKWQQGVEPDLSNQRKIVKIATLLRIG